MSSPTGTPSTETDDALDRCVELAAELARQARPRSYSPYSDFPMGAAVIGHGGEEIQGVLVENVSLGLAMCSERVALFTAVTRGVRPRVLALNAKRTSGELTFPCGACLQVSLELAGPDLVVVAVDTDGQREQVRLGDILPNAPSRHRFGD